MADSDNTTTLPFVIGQQRDELGSPMPQTRDSALSLWSEWQHARHTSLLLCRLQQRLECKIMINPGIQGLTAESPTRVQDQTAHTLGDPRDYAVAREAEVFANDRSS